MMVYGNQFALDGSIYLRMTCCYITKNDKHGNGSAFSEKSGYSWNKLCM